MGPPLAETSAAPALPGAEPARPRTEAYTWNHLPIGDGGYVTGIVAHPLEPDLVYLRTDVGGAYRWDPDDHVWVPLTDHWGLRDRSYYGIDGIALDPQDPDHVYICAGRGGTKSAVFKSVDRGRTWQKLKDLSFDGNGELRWAGEPIALDPGAPHIIYVGSREDGLHRSRDAGKTWDEVAEVPQGTPGIGIRAVAFGHDRLPGGQSRTVYAAVDGDGIWVSRDAGRTWSPLPGSPARVPRMTVAADGTLFATSDEGVFKHAGSWQEISPDDGGFSALDVARDDPDTLIVGGDYRTSEFGWSRSPVHLSRDGGRTWTNVTEGSRVDFMVPWYADHRMSAATSTLMFDPAAPRRVWLADWYQVLVTEDVAAPTVRWTQRVAGLEVASTLSLSALPAVPGGASALLLSGFADVSGFRHTKLTRYPEERHDVGPDTTGIDFCECDPRHVLMVGGHHGRGTGTVAYSVDNGETFAERAWPYGPNGRVAMSATDPDLAVVLPVAGAPVRTTDAGRSWASTSGAPPGGLPDFWSRRMPLASDRVRGQVFYYLAPDGGFYRSTDGGATWSRRSRLPASGESLVKAAPGLADEVWVSGDREGLFRSGDGGGRFARLPRVSRAFLFGFGKGRGNTSRPALYLYGTVEGAESIFRSDDLGQSWVDIGQGRVPFGANPKVLEGDRQVFGRVYLGLGGRGIVYGAPEAP